MIVHTTQPRLRRFAVSREQLLLARLLTKLHEYSPTGDHTQPIVVQQHASSHNCVAVELSLERTPHHTIRMRLWFFQKEVTIENVEGVVHGMRYDDFTTDSEFISWVFWQVARVFGLEHDYVPPSRALRLLHRVLREVVPQLEALPGAPQFEVDMMLLSKGTYQLVITRTAGPADRNYRMVNRRDDGTGGFASGGPADIKAQNLVSFDRRQIADHRVQTILQDAVEFFTNPAQ